MSEIKTDIIKALEDLIPEAVKDNDENVFVEELVEDIKSATEIVKDVQDILQGLIK